MAFPDEGFDVGVDYVVLLEEFLAIHWEKAARCIKEKSEEIHSVFSIIDPIVERSSMIVYAHKLNKYLFNHEDDCGDEYGTKNLLECRRPAVWCVARC